MDTFEGHFLEIAFLRNFLFENVKTLLEVTFKEKLLKRNFLKMDSIKNVKNAFTFESVNINNITFFIENKLH